ncbi:hypothetical protein V2V90_24420 (plasmid) [Agrobacterium leguminum]|uniref:hypothetical protein n=1 Tax=Agrobacterium leguminum TaxID=2792015 RepID=UPI0030CDBA7D
MKNEYRLASLERESDETSDEAKSMLFFKMLDTPHGGDPRGDLRGCAQARGREGKNASFQRCAGTDSEMQTDPFPEASRRGFQFLHLCEAMK